MTDEELEVQVPAEESSKSAEPQKQVVVDDVPPAALRTLSEEEVKQCCRCEGFL